MDYQWQPTSNAAKAIQKAGFIYDPIQNCMLTTIDAWQRETGYCYAYDVAAPVAINAVIDCEPIFFNYNGVEYMIELWKGQYGSHSGAEIGVYTRTKPHTKLDKTVGHRPHDPENSKFFDCADDSQLLKMSFSLYRRGELLFTRATDAHWWLTGFRLGVFSTPDDLTMSCSFELPDPHFRRSFIEGSEKIGYKPIEDHSTGVVTLLFGKPFTVQPRLDPRCEDFINSAYRSSREMVDIYLSLNLPNNDPNLIQDSDICKVMKTYLCNTPEHLIRGVTKVLRVLNLSANEVQDVLTEKFKKHTKKCTVM